MLRNVLAGMAAISLTLSCSSYNRRPAGTAGQGGAYGEPAPAAAAPGAGLTPPTTTKIVPVQEKADLVREAAILLVKAGTALEKGNKNAAEQLFSSAELLIGVEGVASVAPLFREGAPPRITTPVVQVDRFAKPQPKAAGSSEAEDEAAKVAPPRTIGSLTGTLQIDGKAGGGLGLITLEPASGTWKPRTPKRGVIEQRGREFFPRVAAIPVGSTLTFPNFDTFFHNVFSTSAAAAFDLGIYKVGEAREYTFKREGIIRLGCNLHANMRAYIAVVAAPSYVVTDDAGAFTFRRLAPGTYTLRAWSEKSAAPITQSITIKPGKNQVTVGVRADAPAGPSPDKFGGPRG